MPSGKLIPGDTRSMLESASQAQAGRRRRALFSIAARPPARSSPLLHPRAGAVLPLKFRCGGRWRARIGSRGGAGSPGGIPLAFHAIMANQKMKT